MKKTPYARQIEELEVLASRFIAILDHLPSFEDGDDYLAKVKEEFPKATHYCYAYLVNGKERCSDDGEPARSVGLPLLDLLRNNELDKAILVVVRYFGGTKLGLGRLARTYREVSENCIKKAAFAEIIKGKEVVVQCDYAHFDQIQHECAKMGIEILEKKFDVEISLFLRGDSKIMEQLLERQELFVKTDSEKDVEIRRIT